MKISIVNKIYSDNKANSIGTYNVIRQLKAALAKAQTGNENATIDTSPDDDKYAAEAASLPTDRDYKDDDHVIITGDTKDNRHDIKDYAKEYGGVIAKGKNFKYKDGGWTVTYAVFKKLITDKPSLAAVLFVEPA